MEPTEHPVDHLAPPPGEIIRSMSTWVRFGLLLSVTVVSSAHWVAPTDTTPAYFTAAPRRPTGAILSGAQLTGPNFTHPFQATAYRMAAKIEAVLYQQPCYCRCDRALQHKSLHSCFEGLHGAVCATCMRQAIYSYQQTQAGKTPAEIRAGIQAGDAQNVKLEDASL